MIPWTVTHEDSRTCSTLPTSDLERIHHLHSQNWVDVYMNCGVGFIDADWAGDTDTFQFHTGYILMMNGGPISWKICWQDNVSLSNSKPEFVAASQSAQEVVNLRETLRDFGYPQSTATVIFEDNLACIEREPTKMAKMWTLSGQLPPWLATGAGHGPDGSAPYQYRWADVVWAPCCRDCVMGCCGVLVVFHWPLVARDSHILNVVGLDFCVLAYWGSAALLLSL